MRASFALSCAAVLLGAGVAAAAPGDLVSISGTLQRERNGRVIVRGDDGRIYVPDLTRAGAAPLRLGEPVRIVGREGRRPDEIAVTLLEPEARIREQAGVLVIDGWRLPRSHVYQAQDDRGVYHEVRARDVPATILRGKEVYDLTAGAWVNHPTAYAGTGGRNPAYTMAAEPPVVSGDVLVIDGWRLPRSHVYQAQDDQGVYHEVRVRDIPATILRGKEVYDLTVGAWVNHPTAYASTAGRNPAYTGAAEPPTLSRDAVLIDGWRLPRSHVYIAQDDRGLYREVRLVDVPATILRGKEVYDQTAGAWVNHPTAYAVTGGRNPAYTASAADYPGRRNR